MIHRYVKNGLHFVLDVNSGAVHVLDELCLSLIHILDLEENFGITISDEEATQMSTIGDIVKYIEEHQD